MKLNTPLAGIDFQNTVSGRSHIVYQIWRLSFFLSSMKLLLQRFFVHVSFKKLIVKHGSSKHAALTTGGSEAFVIQNSVMPNSSRFQ